MTEDKKNSTWYADMRLLVFWLTEFWMLTAIAASLRLYGLVMVGVPWVLWTWELYGRYTRYPKDQT